MNISALALAATLLNPTTLSAASKSTTTSSNPFIVSEGSLPMISAHRGGGVTNPENTLKAYKACVNDYKVEMLETDLWMTKDGYLVFNHDESIDRMSDASILEPNKKEHLISDYTLEQLRNFNMGYNFSLDGKTYPYRNVTTINSKNRKQVLKDNDLQIVEMSECFQEFYTSNPDLLFSVEIKDDGDNGIKAVKLIDECLTRKYPKYKNNIVLGTFHGKVEKEIKNNHPTLMYGASTASAVSFVLTSWIPLSITKKGYTCLQIPYELYGISFESKNIIKKAHKNNIAVQYWTVNEEKDMRDLIDLKVDAIMTDNPLLLKNVLASYK